MQIVGYNSTMKYLIITFLFLLPRVSNSEVLECSYTFEGKVQKQVWERGKFKYGDFEKVTNMGFKFPYFSGTMEMFIDLSFAKEKGVNLPIYIDYEDEYLLILKQYMLYGDGLGVTIIKKNTGQSSSLIIGLGSNSSRVDATCSSN